MNVGIIVYSQTGNTYAVAGKLQEKIAAVGHAAGVERITVGGKAFPSGKSVQFTTLPQVDQYDALIFGAPVHAFSLAPVMTAYLKQLPSLERTKTACFVTKQWPSHWTGGNRAIAKMKKICTAKGAAVCATAIVAWSESRREQSIDECIERLGNLF